MNPEITCEQMARDHDKLWSAMGGIGDPPPLVVSPDLYRAAVADGFPADRMCVAPDLPAQETKR